MSYKPTPAPFEGAHIPSYLDRELNRIAPFTTQDGMGREFYPRVDPEVDGTIADFTWPYGHAFRYGATGDGATNDTNALRNWLAACSGASWAGYLPQPQSKYITDPLTIPNDVHLVFHRAAILEARTGYGATDTLLNFDGSSNVRIDCNGAICRMLKAEYVSGEQRHCFYLFNCSNIVLNEPVGNDAGGDGFYIAGATDLRIRNPSADNNRRNAMSVIKATRLHVSGIARLTGSTGTAPNNGLDFEPNGPTDSLIDCVFDTVDCSGNVGEAVVIYLDDYQAGSPADVSISIKRIISKGEPQALRVRNVYLNSGSYGGVIAVGEVIARDNTKASIFVEDKSSAGPLLIIGRVDIVNPCTGASVFAETAAVYISDTSAATSGGIHIGPVSIKATHADMDYGVILECGAGFTDLRIGLENVVGHQVTPVRWNNITATIAAATAGIVDTSKLTDTVAVTAASTDIVATTHVGRIVTNAGAGAGTTYNLREYLPQQNPYRFRVEAAQTITIDIFDAADRISGTTGAGQSVTSNVIGAECDVYFLGTFGGVRTWRLQPLGNPASWTFN